LGFNWNFVSIIHIVLKWGPNLNAKLWPLCIVVTHSLYIIMNRDNIFDDFCDEGEMGEDVKADADAAGLKKTHEKLFNDGYRSSKVAAEDTQRQLGFDAGFHCGMERGKQFGRIYCLLRQIIAETTGLGDTQRGQLLARCDAVFAERVPRALRDPKKFDGAAIAGVLKSLFEDIVGGSNARGGVGVDVTGGGAAPEAASVLHGEIAALLEAVAEARLP
jgi:hypothetical protein